MNNRLQKILDDARKDNIEHLKGIGKVKIRVNSEHSYMVETEGEANMYRAVIIEKAIAKVVKELENEI